MLFPDPHSVIANWSDDMATRILPVALFDLSLTDIEQPGPALFLHYDDPWPDFLAWKTQDGMIIEIEGLDNIQPFRETPNLDRIGRRVGSYLDFEQCEIDIGVPSDFSDGSWEDRFMELCEEWVESPGNRLRIGGGYPVYVQSTWGEPDDAPGFVAELPSAQFGLDPRYYYLFAFMEESGYSFQQIMMMT